MIKGEDYFNKKRPGLKSLDQAQTYKVFLSKNL